MKRAISIATILVLLASNVLSLTWDVFQTVASGLLAAAHIPTLHEKRAKANNQKKLIVRKAGANIRKRTLKSAAVNVGSMAGEAVPYLGWAVIIGATAYELKLACDNLLELEGLYDGFDITDEPDRSSVEWVCDPKLPTSADEVSNWTDEIKSPGE